MNTIPDKSKNLSLDTKKIIHFSHANGFPAETYRKLFHYLQDEFQIGYISMHGHNPDYPIHQNWPELVEELLHFIEKNYDQPIYGVGHSLGGILTFIAAIKRPELFKSIVLLEALIPSHFRSKLFQLAKKLGVFSQFTSAKRAKKRRIEWANFNEALEYFRGKPLFEHFDPECLEDYVRYGTLKNTNGIILRFDRNIESDIFRTVPHDLPRYRRQLSVPAALIYSEKYSIVNPFDRFYMKKHFGIQSIPIKGTHLFPFEYPELTASYIKKLVNT